MEQKSWAPEYEVQLSTSQPQRSTSLYWNTNFSYCTSSLFSLRILLS